jgi:uncharacterized protein
MLVSELDGFLAGVLVCPELIMPGEWLPRVWGGGDEDAAPLFENLPQVKKLIGLIMEHYNATANDLSGGYYSPVFDVDARHDEILWELWIDGFETAMKLRPESWSAIIAGDEETRAALAGLLALAAINCGDSSLREEEISDLTETAPDLIPYWVNVLNVWRRRRSLVGLSEPHSSTVKVGRNDLCPCGSGKKYKKCCGLN